MQQRDKSAVAHTDTGWLLFFVVVFWSVFFETFRTELGEEVNARTLLRGEGFARSRKFAWLVGDCRRRVSSLDNLFWRNLNARYFF